MLGLTETAEMLDMTVPALWNRYQRGTVVPPVARLRSGPVWDRRDVVAWQMEQTRAQVQDVLDRA